MSDGPAITHSVRIGSLEVRVDGVNIKNDTIAEIVRWQESGTCYVIAFIRQRSRHKTETPDVEFVGDRPFGNGIDWNQFGLLCRTWLSLWKETQSDRDT